MGFGTPFGFMPEEKPVAEKPAAKAPKVKSEPKKPKRQVKKPAKE